MQKHTLKAEKRTISGKKVKNLRHDGLLPANVYGKNIKSQAVQVDLKDFQKTFGEVGETGLVELDLGGNETRPILIHNVQLDPLSDLPIHSDFYQVSLKEKITTKVPVVVVKEAPAVSNKEGVLLTLLDEVEVEALPTDLPEKIELDISQLKSVDQELNVQDLKVDSSKITIKSNPVQTLVKIGPLITEEMKKAMEEEAAKAAAAQAAAAPAEGVAPTEGTVPAESKAPEAALKKEEPVAKQEEKK